MRKVSKHLLVVVATMMMALTGCGKDGKTGTPGGKAGTAAALPPVEAPAFMDLIPADTPYAFVSSRQLPTEAMDKIFGAFEPLLKKLDEEIGKELARPAGDGMDDKIGRAIAEELKGNLNKAGLEKMGLSTTPRFAVYGVGVLPVFRFELGNPKALTDMIGRVETKAGAKENDRPLLAIARMVDVLVDQTIAIVVYFIEQFLVDALDRSSAERKPQFARITGRHPGL